MDSAELMGVVASLLGEKKKTYTVIAFKDYLFHNYRQTSHISFWPSSMLQYDGYILTQTLVAC